MADQSSSVKDTKHGTTINGNSKTVSSPKVNEFDLLASPSPDSPLDDSFRNVDDKCISSNASSHDHDKVIQLGSVNIEKPVSGSSIPHNEPSDHESPLPVSTPAVTGGVSDSSSDKDLAIESPATQVMERSSYDPNRIPASVFERNKSTNPMEWSTASNESLFSIHMGNMSFTKDQFLWRSGELGPPGEASTSGQIFNFSSNQSPATKSADRKSGELRTEAAVETMKEIIRESEDQSNEKSIAEGRISHISLESGTSTKSFAFPVLAGDADQGSSVRIAGSARVVPDQQQPKPQPKSDPSPQPEPKANEATQKASNTKWFSCFSCCSFCS